jgi:hypothetical protein
VANWAPGKIQKLGVAAMKRLGAKVGYSTTPLQ